MKRGEASPSPPRLHLVLLLGVGASVPLGLPDTCSLLKHLTDLSGGLDTFLASMTESHGAKAPDVEWILERIDLYEDLGVLLSEDRNLRAEVIRSLADVLKRCSDSAELIRSAFPEWSLVRGYRGSLSLSQVPPVEGVVLPTALGSLSTVESPGWASASQLGIGAPPVTLPLAVREFEPVRVSPPPFKPGVDPKAVASAMLSGTCNQARLLRKAIYANIIRIYGSIDGRAVERLYAPLLQPLWSESLSRGTGMAVFTTNWDPVFDALRESPLIPIETGIAGQTFDLHWEPSLYDRGRLDVYRLHGCCRWVTSKNDPGRILYSSLPTKQDDEYEVPVLYRPRTKPNLVLDEPYATGYAAMDRAASKPSVWVVIGYSFRDQPVQRILERAAARGAISRLIVVDPARRVNSPAELGPVTYHIPMEFGSQGTLVALLEAVAYALRGEEPKRRRRAAAEQALGSATRRAPKSAVKRKAR